MAEQDNSESFSFTYSAPTERERKEIEEIRSRYLPKKEREEKYQKTKKINSRVNFAVKFSLAFGIVTGVLILGGGLSLTLLNPSGSAAYISGIVLGVLGIITALLSIPVYKKVKAYMRNKYGGEILSLTEELLSGEEKDG